jgi:NAD+ synthase (glutamine-hydrolysing)
VIVYSMARQVVKAIKEGNGQVIQDALRICAVDQEQWVLRATPKDVMNKVFHTCFMGTENSSRDTRDRAEKLAQAIGAYHTDMNMDSVVTA